MEAETKYHAGRIDHLGIVAGICQEIGLIEEIDQRVGTSGQGTQAMMLNALGFSSCALYLMPDYMHNKPVDVLIGPGLVAEDFNDDRLGRSLDVLYARGVTEIFVQVAALVDHVGEAVGTSAQGAEQAYDLVEVGDTAGEVEDAVGDGAQHGDLGGEVVAVGLVEVADFGYY